MPDSWGNYVSRAWDHTLTPYTADELAAWEAKEQQLNEREGGAEWLAKRGHVYWYECSAAKCKERPTFRITYRYVTGRAGRVSWAEKDYCPAHAEKFAAKHGLATEVPT